MMQIYIDAIQKSRIDEIQYVLQKSLDMVCVSNHIKLLMYLKNGWNIVGKYNNGVGYDSYSIISETEINSIKRLIEELLGFNIKSANSIYISFQEFFEPITCVSEGLNVDITFFEHINGKFNYENFRFEDEKAKRVRDLLFILNVKQDKARVINILEKKM